ncbi:O-methyltransferase [Fodinibius salsisoli]|uniref:Class I SAM-dependent methyltransferase n=1 Tax=Fodinibius salsisoli TaxID=2820877 RepID=A0ABT3PNH5_9BACT|nr:class I SAM-dependent methyltransferase [Fodinibius salsisoli]MCW9707407.1 class I SAM-dependent methyltransferase [Fodinibius salsisoli]
MIVNDIEAYAAAHTTDDSELIRELIKASDEDLEHIDMLSGRLVGRLLAFLVKISNARRVLEVGTFTGYSALTMAEALPKEGVLFTCEYNKRYESIARTFFEKSEHGSKINLVMGKALETIPDISGTFDLIFLDADKINYPNYYELLLPRLKKGGILAVDNVLWGGEAVNPESDKAKAIDQLNKQIAKDESVEQVLLPVRDGLTVVRKR